MFKDWLAGYLEGKESLNKDEIELIKTKTAELEPYQPISIPWSQPIEPYYRVADGVTTTAADHFTVNTTEVN